MGHLIVLTTRELEPGFRLAGVTTRPLDSAGEAAELVDELIARPDDGDVSAGYEPVGNGLPAVRRRRGGARVVALPGGEGAHVEAERRAQHLRILWEAVGYQITFDKTDDAT